MIFMSEKFSSVSSLKIGNKEILKKLIKHIL